MPREPSERHHLRLAAVEHHTMSNREMIQSVVADSRRMNRRIDEIDRRQSRLVKRASVAIVAAGPIVREIMVVIKTDVLPVVQQIIQWVSHGGS